MPAVTLDPLDDDHTIGHVVAAAVAGAEPREVMPVESGEPAGVWTDRLIEALGAYHRARIEGLPGRHRERGFAVVADGATVGVARLRELGDDRLETGIWLVRSSRGRSIGTRALEALVTAARESGHRTLVADTTPHNTGALTILERCGATLSAADDDGIVYAEIDLHAEA